MKRLILAACIALSPAVAHAWGGEGHRIVGRAAMRALPAEVPAFLRTAQAVADVGEWSREPDRWKDAGKIHDHDRDAGHFVDIDDDGRLLGGPPFAPMPPTKADYEAGLRSAGLDMWKAGYLQYSIVDAWQQLAKDFAYWRVLHAAEQNPRWRANRAWFQADRRRREAAILQNLGRLSHYVADGSQPLHVTVHFNGWGDYPNPKGYTTERLHGRFESDFVRQNVKAAPVYARVAPFRPSTGPIEERTVTYLLATHKLVEPLYALEKVGGLQPGDPRGIEFATRQLAAGASELRDLVVEAWRNSATQKVGWRPVAVADVVAGRVDPFPALYGVD